MHRWNIQFAVLIQKKYTNIILLMDISMYIQKIPKNGIVQQGINHDKPYVSNISGVNMLIFMAKYYNFL